MLRKQLKHEYKATARFFLPVYLVFAALLVVQRLSMLAFFGLEQREDFVGAMVSFLMGILTTISVVSLIALLVSPLIYALIRFWKNMLGDQGYLTNTLPVSIGSNILTKLLVGGSWFVITAIVTLLCGLLYALSIDAAGVREFFETLGMLFREASRAHVTGWIVTLLVLLLVNLLIQLCANLLTAFSAMSIGQMVNSHKLLASAGAYIGILFATTTLIQALMISIGSVFGDSIAHYINQLAYTPETGYRALCGLLLISLLLNCLNATVHFFLSRYFLSKKLNLA